MGASVAIAAGVVLTSLALWDAFSTIILPQTVPHIRPSRFVAALSWRLWRWVSRHVPSRLARQTFLSFFGPFSILLALGLWTIMLLFAFALLHWGLGTRLNEPAGGFGTFLYMSGTTFFTLGLGDVFPLNALGRGLVVLEVATGIVFLAMIIGYLPLLHQAYAQREVGIDLLESRAGSPQSALLLLRRFGSPDHAAVFYTILLEAERWAATVSQSHIAHPGLVFYRSQHLGRSWLGSLTTLLDGCALLMVTGERRALSRQAQTTFRTALRVAVDMARILSPGPAAGERLPTGELTRLRDALQPAGITLSPEVVTRLAELRRLYEPRVLALSAWLLVPLPPWVPGAVESGDGPEFAGLDDLG